MGYHTSYLNEKCKGYCDIIVKNKRRFLFCSIVDSHLHVELFGAIKLDLKLKSKYPYKNAKIYGLSNKKQKPALIVSLTSYPERINTVSQAINTLLQQTLKPDKLILWLANEQFPNKELDLPADLLKLKELGLEINWCEDLKSYKKLIPSLHLFPDDIIVTADDDLYYQPDWLESLYKSYLKNPDCIHTRKKLLIHCY